MSYKMKNLLLFTIFLILLLPGKAQTVIDISGNVYTTVKIGSQVWMAENLNTYTQYGSWATNNNFLSTEIYGRLYNWKTAMNICPSGWHLPSDTEWETLINFLGGDTIAGGKLKSRGTAYWRKPNDGATNSSGFAALPGGDKISYHVGSRQYESFSYLNDNAFFWSSTQNDRETARYMSLSYLDNDARRGAMNKEVGYSVRCIQDYQDTSSCMNTKAIDELKTYLKNGGDVNAKNEQGYTALMLAAANGDAKAVSFLLNAKADPMIEDYEGNTAFNLASANGHDYISMMLLYPAKRLSGWNRIIPNHVTSRYITDDRFNYEADTNMISMELDIGKKRALEFYRDELIKAGWNVDEVSFADSEEGALSNPALWGILKAGNDPLTLTMSIRSDQYTNPTKHHISIYDSTMTLQGQYTNTPKTRMDVFLINKQAGTNVMKHLPKEREIPDQLNQRFASQEWAVTLHSVVNEGSTVSNKDNITGSVYTFKINTPNTSLIRVKLTLERLNGKPIKESFLSVGVRVKDIEGNEFPAVGAGTGTAEFCDLTSSALQSFMIPMQPESDVEYVFAVPEGKLVSKFIWPDIAPIEFPVIKAYLEKPAVKSVNTTITKSYDNGEYTGEFKGNLRHGQGTYTWTSGKYTGDKYVGEWENGIKSGQGIYTWANGDEYNGNWINNDQNGFGTYTWNDGSTYAGQWENGIKSGHGERTWANGDKYAGEWENDRKNGQGTYTWADGNIYTGEWVNDKRNGQGTFTWTGGNRYEGEWADDIRSGQGTFTWADGDRFTGNWENNMMNGQGTITWANGDTYVGDWENDMRSGKGTLTWINGDKYTGEFQDNRKSGKGKYTWTNGDQYNGEWKEDQMYNGTKYNKEGKKVAVFSGGVSHLVGKWTDNTKDGNGTYLWANGDKYTGECKDGIKSGQGEKTWSNGDKYVGEWENDMRNGQGTFTWADGDMYVGGWKNDLKNGQGTLTWADGDVYSGDWTNDTRTGQGTYTWADGETYTGEFKDGNRNGQGTYTWANGDKYVGEWKDGHMHNGIKYNKEGKKIASYSEGVKQ